MPGSQNEMFPPTSIINSELQDSNKEKLFFFPTPAGSLGWLGGCGVMTCTGGNNTVVRDIDGKFLGAVSQVLPNNDIGKNLTNCIRRNTWNGYECQGYTVGQIVFENNGRDATSKISFPVELRSRDGRFSNTINGQMEWAWNGAEPLNKRLNRFSGIIPYDLHYDLIYTSGAPGMTRYKIIQQQESGGDSRYYIFSTVFSLNMSVQVNTPRGIIDPIITGSITDKIECGRNSFNNIKNEITFIVTNDPGCVVGVKQLNSIKMNTRIEVTIQEFISTSGPTKLINNLAATLGIDTSQIKIVGLREGSVIIEYFISEKPVWSDPSVDSNAVLITNSTREAASSFLSTPTPKQSELLTEATKNTAISKTALSTLKRDIIAIMQNQEKAAALTGYKVLSYSIQVAIDDNGTVTGISVIPNTLNIGLIIGLSVAAVLIVMIIVGTVCYFRFKKNNKVDVVEIEAVDMTSDKPDNEVPESEFSMSQKF
jgi:hypothetical protein